MFQSAGRFRKISTNQELLNLVCIKRYRRVAHPSISAWARNQIKDRGEQSIAFLLDGSALI